MSERVESKQGGEVDRRTFMLGSLAALVLGSVHDAHAEAASGTEGPLHALAERIKSAQSESASLEYGVRILDMSVQNTDFLRSLGDALAARVGSQENPAKAPTQPHAGVDKVVLDKIATLRLKIDGLEEDVGHIEFDIRALSITPNEADVVAARRIAQRMHEPEKDWISTTVTPYKELYECHALLRDVVHLRSSLDQIERDLVGRR